MYIEPRILNTKDEMTIAVKKQLKQLQSKALKKIQGFNGIRTHDLRDTGPALCHWAMKALWEQGQVWVQFIPVTGWEWDNLYTLSACTRTADIEY